MGKTINLKINTEDFYKHALGTRVAELPRSAKHRDKKRYNRKENKRNLREQLS